jgi:hypothetical protein
VLSEQAVLRGYKENNWSNQVSSVQESVKKKSTFGRVSQFRKDLSTEAEK